MHMRTLTFFPLLILTTSIGAALPATAGPYGTKNVASVSARSADKITKADALRAAMRDLWTDHVVWTRVYIIAAVGNGADKQAATERLLENQEDIGDAIAGYYGRAAGDKLTDLLKDHILIAADVVTAAKANKAADLANAKARWQSNADDIAKFLADANPHWPQEALEDMMDKHLSTTTDEVVARLQGDWDADIKAYDVVYDHILMMSDTLSDGIIAQYPERF
ncbi:MAG: glycosyltransferase [bacterium]